MFFYKLPLTKSEKYCIFKQCKNKIGEIVLMKTSGKYVQIADQLTQKIIEQAYFDRLPPVRDLAQEYNVSLRTIQKALELLAQRTLIVADSTRGVRVIHRPASRVIGVFCNFRKGNSSDLLVQSLRRRIEADNYEAIFIDVPEKVCQDENSAIWRYGWADGYISLYGTSDFAIDRCLNNFDLPVVTANLGKDRNIPCVDFDHSLLLSGLLEGLYKKNYRKFALSFTICSERISNTVEAAFRDFLNTHQLPVLEPWITRSSEEAISTPRDARIAKQFETIFSTAEKPDAIICFHHGMSFAKALIGSMDLKLGRDIVLAGTGKGDIPEPGFLPVEFSYEDLAEGLWKSLKKQLNGQQAVPQTHLLPPQEINWQFIEKK